MWQQAHLLHYRKKCMYEHCWPQINVALLNGFSSDGDLQVPSGTCPANFTPLEPLVRPKLAGSFLHKCTKPGTVSPHVPLAIAEGSIVYTLEPRP